MPHPVFSDLQVMEMADRIGHASGDSFMVESVAYPKLNLKYPQSGNIWQYSHIPTNDPYSSALILDPSIAGTVILVVLHFWTPISHGSEPLHSWSEFGFNCN
jgi:hypothetical protein